MLKRRTSKRPWNYKEWKCICGAKTGMQVVKTEHDEDGKPIRIRKCKNCGDHMATIEEPINLDSFYGRAESHRRNGLRSLRRKPRYCKFCERKYGEKSKQSEYRYRNYSDHIILPQHLAAIKSNPSPAMRRMQAAKSRRYYWSKRGLESLAISDVLKDLRNTDGTINRVIDSKEA